MDKIVIPAQPVVGVAKGQTATCDLAIGPRYHTIWIEAIATGAAGKTVLLTDVLGLITLKINGKPQRIHTADEINQIQKSYDASQAAIIWKVTGGVPVEGTAPGNADVAIVQLGIKLAEPWRKSYAATEMMGWYTAWQDGSKLGSLQLEIACPNTGNLDAAAAYTIQVYAETDNALGPLDSSKRPIALITKFNRVSLPYTGAGDVVLNTLNKSGIYNQISLFGQSGDNVTHVKVTRDNQVIRDVDKWRNDQTLVGREWNVAALTVDRFDIGFDYSDLPTDGLNLNGTNYFEVKATLGAAAAANKIISVVSQVYEQADF